MAGAVISFPRAAITSPVASSRVTSPGKSRASTSSNSSGPPPRANSSDNACATASPRRSRCTDSLTSRPLIASATSTNGTTPRSSRTGKPASDPSSTSAGGISGSCDPVSMATPATRRADSSRTYRRNPAGSADACEPAGQQQLAAAKKVRDVNWTTMGCFVAGIAATWLFMYGATSLTQGFAARALGGLDLSWLAGGGVAAALYSVLGPRAHRPYRITGQPPTRSSATTDSPDVLAGN
ncbi:hypothetical protein JOJ86_006361 [Rhodococcus percolatus]|nr:hypothetical protein [Rhodococcus opacus]MBP2208635.1 hypothetical protein [Rhodococcus opacus]